MLGALYCGRLSDDDADKVWKMHTWWVPVPRTQHCPKSTDLTAQAMLWTDQTPNIAHRNSNNYKMKNQHHW